MRVIGTLAVLAVAAFALGAGAGLLWKEPRLVVADWMGDTQEVPWSPGEETAAWPEGEQAEPTARAETAAAAPTPAAGEPEVELPSVAASAAKPAKPARAAQLASAKPAAAPAVSAAPPAHGGVAVQVGAFAERPAADALVTRLKGGGYSAYVVPGSTAPWRVRVGPYRDRPAAESAAAKLAKLSLPTWIQEEPGGR